MPPLLVNANNSNQFADSSRTWCPISIEITRVTNVSKTRNESLSDGNKTRGIIMAG